MNLLEQKVPTFDRYTSQINRMIIVAEMSLAQVLAAQHGIKEEIDRLERAARDLHTLGFGMYETSTFYVSDLPESIKKVYAGEVPF